MNLRFASRFLALAFVASITQASAQTPALVFPYEPAQLLAVLPTTPADWKVLRSDAGMTLGDWVETRATRIFEAPPAPPTADNPAPAPSGQIALSVIDTAGYTPALAAFADFRPEKTGDVEKKLLGSLPAIVVVREDGRQFVRVLVASRYIVELTLTNLPRHRAEDWLRGFHFDALPATSKTPTVRPQEFRLSRVDELQPKKNRSYVVATTSATRMDAFLKSLPPEKNP